jgi:ABC-type siderophore export system fused ATPase/permease subunit/CubicO group peptidase (beta-lactamase class C family)
MRIGFALAVLCLVTMGSTFASQDGVGQDGVGQADPARLVSELTRRWELAQIPTGGLSVVVGDVVLTRRLGAAEPGAFELASCSKAFTGLLIAVLEQEGVLDRQDPITRWLPELAERPELGYSAVRIENLLGHTSGISGDTLGLLEPDSSADALSRLPLLLKDTPLAHAVGTHAEYATLNYSLLGILAERATGKSFASLLRDKLFLPLGMLNTWVEGSAPLASGTAASARVPGYKISFTAARSYDAPRYRQNTPSGYVLSTPEDMAIWLQFFLQPPLAGASDPALAALRAAREQVRRLPQGSSRVAYTYGWDVQIGTTAGFSHPGQNPNAYAYVAFDPATRVGVALLGNSNSPQVVQVGQALFEHLRGSDASSLPPDFADDIGDWVCTIGAFVFWLGGLSLLAQALSHRRRADGHEEEPKADGQLAIMRESLVLSTANTGWGRFIGGLVIQNLVLLSVLAAVPRWLLGLGWDSLRVWGPASLPIAAAGLVFLVNALHVCFFLVVRRASRYSGNALASLLAANVVGLTVIAGLLSSIVVILILEAVETVPHSRPYIAVLLFACIYWYVTARKSAELQIMRFGHTYVQGWRMEIIRKLLASEYQHIERLSPGRIQAVVGEDSQELAKGVLAFVPFFANLSTIVFLFAYLLVFKSALATLVLFACAVPMIVLYYYASKRADRLMPRALATRGEFMGSVEDLQKGYKGLGREAVKRNFFASVELISERFRSLRVAYERGFLNAFFVGEALLAVLLVAVALAFPLLIPSFGAAAAKDYLVILLYLIGPLNAVMVAIPELVRIKGLLQNMLAFSESIPATAQPASITRTAPLQTLELRDVQFRYPPAEGEVECFGIGPVSLRAECGKSYFLTGGNGSGKSTLAMILAGLYTPSAGTILINGEPITRSQLLEHAHAIFSDSWLFRRVYSPELLRCTQLVNQNIGLLGMAQRATLRADGTFDTIKLSTGQRKRLSLAMLLADPSPLVVLDEWGAEQDPTARARFYKEWVPMLKAQRRVVFVVTHDDEYFAEADVLITMKNGQFVEVRHAQATCGLQESYS